VSGATVSGDEGNFTGTRNDAVGLCLDVIIISADLGVGDAGFDSVCSGAIGFGWSVSVFGFSLGGGLNALSVLGVVFGVVFNDKVCTDADNGSDKNY